MKGEIEGLKKEELLMELINKAFHSFYLLQQTIFKNVIPPLPKTKQAIYQKCR